MKVKTLVVCFAVASIAAPRKRLFSITLRIARAGGEAGR